MANARQVPLETGAERSSGPTDGTDHSRKAWPTVSAAGEELQVSGRKMAFGTEHDQR